ncbi:MAG TPA: hypothetical protein VFU98_17370 [Microlunatus sp.]|nr:hypothetical protein [Microlunatus sp.]
MSDDLPVDVLVIDGANVVGSRPDGWWRDRPGAAARLHSQLVGAGLTATMILVLEGRARAGVSEGAAGGGRIEVVHAAGEGDDRIVAEARAVVSAGRSVAVVTADRGLSARVEAVGARAVRPGWLLDRLGAR